MGNHLPFLKRKGDAIGMKKILLSFSLVFTAVLAIGACGGGGGGSASSGSGSAGSGASVSTNTGTSTATGTAVGGCTHTATYTGPNSSEYANTVTCAVYSGTLYNQADLKAACTGSEPTTTYTTTVYTWSASGCPVNQSLICTDGHSANNWIQLMGSSTYYYNLSAADLSRIRAECLSLGNVVSY